MDVDELGRVLIAGLLGARFVYTRVSDVAGGELRRPTLDGP